MSAAAAEPSRSSALPGSQRTVLVTGATSGIGRAVAVRLLADGHRVVGVGRDFAKADLGGDRFVAEPLDLADLDRLPAALDALARRHPEVDALVLAAGRGDFGGLEELSYGRIRSLIELDLTATVFVVKAFLPALKRRGRGDVVVIGSEAALAGRREGTVYCAAKAGLRAFAQALREESARSGVRVSAIQPGMVATPFFDKLDFEPGPAPENRLDAVEVAAAVAFVLERGGAAVVDELVLTPLKRVVAKRAPKRRDRPD